MTNSQNRAADFHNLHASGCFVIPNPWDVGSARMLAAQGFQALATTSAGFAWSQGKADNRVKLPQLLDHFRAITASVEIPVNADFEGGFDIEPPGVFDNVTLAVETGIAGLSIEDSTGIEASPLFGFDLSVDRMKAARKAIDESKTKVVLTGRSEGFIVGRPDLAETIRRLTAYADAGADCLYAPGIRDIEQVKTIVKELAPKPINILVNGNFFTVQQLADVGVRRISVGGALAKMAYTALVNAAKEISELGTFNPIAPANPPISFDKMFA
ncbi:MAG: isocitrate lyase/phosphoenolpyruvate mutase family protein [Gemmatimonadaceae bacterium]